MRCSAFISNSFLKINQPTEHGNNIAQLLTNNGESPRSQTTQDYVTSKMRTKTIEKMIGEPTIVSYGILEDQLAVMASTVKTTQWGRKHGHLALVVGDGHA